MENSLISSPTRDAEVIKSFLNRDIVEDAIEKTNSFARLMSYYKCAIMEIETKFKVLNQEFSLMFDREPISTIKTRLKNPLSIRQKMLGKDYPMTFESMEDNLNDIAGIRVICSFVDDVYMLADALRKQDDIEIVREKDYIKNPKENGYRSLHLIVTVPIFLQNEKRIMKAEVQLRTIAMDSWASLEHQLRYKKDPELFKKHNDQLRHCAKLSSELDSCMNMIKSDIYGQGLTAGIDYSNLVDFM